MREDQFGKSLYLDVSDEYDKTGLQIQFFGKNSLGEPAVKTHVS